MHFSSPPSVDDLQVLAQQILASLPTELEEHIEDLKIAIEEFPDEVIIQEMELENSYELLALYRSGSEIAPGIVKKQTDHDDCLILFRRPILDLWCETGEDINHLMREVIVEEIARAHEFPEQDIKQFLERSY